jgi:hypothetical protein
MNVAIFWDIAPCSPYLNRRFGGKYHPHLQGRTAADQEISVSHTDCRVLYLKGWQRLFLMIPKCVTVPALNSASPKIRPPAGRQEMRQ